MKRYSDFTLLFADDNPRVRTINNKAFAKEAFYKNIKKAILF